jgi:hypothetical protein
MARPTSAVPQLTKDDVRFCERSMAGLAAAKTDASGDSDGLLKYGYHQNPYMRTFVKVLWSGYAISRNQLADGSQRFSQARRDATVSNIDQLTTKSLDDAAKALEGAMSPSGSLGTFLTELRERTMPRLWSRVCETAGLPPPSFHTIYGHARKASHDDLDAEEEADIAALRKAPSEVAVQAFDDEDEDDTLDDDDDDAAEGEDATGVEAVEGEARAPAPQPRERTPRPDRAERSERAAGGEAALALTTTRNGGVDLAAELLMSAVSEVLRELRTRQATGSLKFTIQVEGQRADRGGDRGRGEPRQAEPRTGDQPEGERGDGNGQRRRRRRR